jgi:outer membrane protein, heavy metal efflux system
MRNQLGGLLPLAVLLVGQAAAAQIAVPASPRVGAPLTSVGPPAPLDGPSSLPQRPNGPLPSSLTLVTALGEAEARSPAIAAARANVQAAQGRLRQAGFRANPEISVEVENFLGSGDYAGVEGAEVTVALNQRLDLGGRRSARRAGAQAALVSAELALVAAHADVAQSVRQQFAIAVAAREELRIARDAEARAIELARIAGILVDAGREPPLRAIRARAAAAQAAAARQAAEANEIAARRTLAALFGQDTPPASVVGEIEALEPTLTPAEQTLEVLSARADLAVAQAALEQELAARRLDPAVGIGVRHLQATGDQALVAGLSLPIPIRDGNQGNIAAARAEIAAAQARLDGALVAANLRIGNARAGLQSAEARLAALENAAIPEAGEALRLAELSYRAGKIPLLELLDAQTALAAAETALVQARLARAQAAAELTRATARQD